MIYHIVPAETWQNFENKAAYVADSLQTEGFVHCSTEAQVAGVLARFYAGVPNLLLLHIDEQKLTCPLKYEPAPDASGLFPHVFGPINLAAVVKITDTQLFQ